MRRLLAHRSWLLAVGMLAGGASLGCSRAQEQPPGSAGAPAQAAASAPAQAAAAQCAPSPPPITCPNGEGFGFTVIELYEEANVCRARTNGSEKFTTLRTAWSNFANWDICNRCSTAVDVRLRNWDPGEPPQRNFLYTNPMWDSSNTIEVHTVCPQKHGDITGLLKDGAGEPDFKSIDYQTSWRVSGQLAWNDIDPRLEIERDGGMLFQKLLQFWKMPGQRGRGR